ncbi:MAG: dipeptidase PepE, partial [Salibacteraceae bacterium]
IKRFIKNQSTALFIPYAAVGFSYDEYEAKVQKALGAFVEVKSIHHYTNSKEAVLNAEAIIIGGGNTFQLLMLLQNNDLIEVIQHRVKENIPYIGWSAGSNIACPTIKTTNDMPIAEPNNFNALNLVNYQINPHYTEQTLTGHGGESRLQRLMEYAAINDVPTVCLPEGCAIKIEAGITKLISSEPCKFIQKGGKITSLQHGEISI